MRKILLFLLFITCFPVLWFIECGIGYVLLSKSDGKTFQQIINNLELVIRFITWFYLAAIIALSFIRYVLTPLFCELTYDY